MIKLDLAYNKLNSIEPETFSKLRNLRFLDLGANRLAEIEHSCNCKLHFKF